MNSSEFLLLDSLFLFPSFRGAAHLCAGFDPRLCNRPSRAFQVMAKWKRTRCLVMNHRLTTEISQVV